MNGFSAIERPTIVMMLAVLGPTLLWAGAPAHAQTILYVDQNASEPAHDGWTWCTAFTDLQDALDVAVWNVVIRVADGTYTPDRGTGAREATFQLTTMVAVEGGYAGCGAPDPDERDLELYETILSGDLKGDDGPDFANNDENSWRVVTDSGNDATAVLDGFTITGGNADGGRSGGGVFHNGGHATVASCIFTGNSADWGGGMSAFNGSDPTLINCEFIGNSAVHGGGVFSENNSDITLTNCVLSGNVATNGGGMYVDDGEPVLTNCSFSENFATLNGGGMFNTHSSTTVTLDSCIFTGNSALDGGAMFSQNGNLSLTNCLLSGNVADQGGGILSTGASGTLINCTFSENSALTGRALHASNVAVTNCILWDGASEVFDPSGTITITYSNVYGGWPGDGNIFAPPEFVDPDGEDDIPGTEDDNLRLLPGSPCIDTGDPSFDPGADATDHDGNPRIIDGGGDGTAIVDMGAHEFQPSDFDGDGDVDLDDFAILADCLAGPGVSTPPGDCTQNQFDVTDLDGDDDVDIEDCATFQHAFTAAQP